MLTYACQHGIFKFTFEQFSALRTRAIAAGRQIEEQIMHEKIEALHAINSRTLEEFWRMVAEEAERAMREKPNFQ